MAFKNEKDTKIFSESTSKFNDSGKSNTSKKSFHVAGASVVKKQETIHHSKEEKVDNSEYIHMQSNVPTMATEPIKSNEHRNIQASNAKAAMGQMIASEQGATQQTESTDRKATENTSSNKKNSGVSKAIVHSIHLHNATANTKHSAGDTVFKEDSYFVDDSGISPNIKSDNDPYIYFDHVENMSDFGDEPRINHDKMALHQTQTRVSGGAEFQSRFSNSGKLKSKIKLDSDSKAEGFIEKSARIFEDFKQEEQETEISQLDSFVETAAYLSVEKASVQRKRYSGVTKDAERQIRQLEKEIRAEETFAQIEDEFCEDVKAPFAHDETEVFENKTETIEISSSEDAVRIEVSYAFQDEAQVNFTDEMNAFANEVQQKFHETKEVEFVEDTHRNESKEIINNEAPNYQMVPTGESGVEIKNNNKDERKTELELLFEGNTEKKDTSPKEEKRFMTKEERLEQLQANRKASKRGEKKALKKMATRTAVAKFLNAKKNMQNQLGDMSGEVTGDLIVDGSTGLLATMTETVKQLFFSALMSVGSAIGKYLTGLIGSLLVPLSVGLVIVALLLGSIAAVGSAIAADSDVGESYDLDVTSDGYVYESLSNEQIDNIIAALYENYSDMTYTQETILRYSLSKVGCAYDQNFHSSLTVDIFDCSSLAYRSYLQAGIDIADTEGKYTAAAECFAMVSQDKIVSDASLKPGDLIFYGGSDNGRYLGVYHVAIYVGKIDGIDKMVEARGTSWGVVYCDVRTANVVKIARPYI